MTVEVFNLPVTKRLKRLRRRQITMKARATREAHSEERWQTWQRNTQETKARLRPFAGQMVAAFNDNERQALLLALNDPNGCGGSILLGLVLGILEGSKS